MSGLRQQISESEGFASSIRASVTWAENDGCVCGVYSWQFVVRSKREDL